MDMVKCPHCGSTAQMEFMWEFDVDYLATTKGYRCGCGCIFEVTYSIWSKPRLTKDNK